MKQCPFCAEQDLQDSAKICKHCGKNIVEAEKPWHKRNISYATFFGVFFVIVGCFFPPAWILAVLLFILAAVK